MSASLTQAGLQTDRPKRRRRWPRIVLPVGLVAVFWLLSLAVHVYQEPNLADPGTLSPLGTGRHGSSELAERLRQRGIEIERVTSSEAAVEAARGRDATILVPAPDLLDGQLLPGLAAARGSYRVVVLRPGLFGRLQIGLPIGLAHSRWAARTVDPGCADPVARQAGPAMVFRDRYQTVDTSLTSCYYGSLVRSRIMSTEIVVVGATEPFRNDRIGEVGNAALATGLLTRHDLLIWVDVHSSELRPRLPNVLPDYERPEQDRTNTGNPLLDAFPVQLWTTFVLLVGAGLLLAIARARRLGPPVPEPLPVVVPAAEAVTGRARLYRRIRAREPSLAILREAALARLARSVDPLARSPERGLADPGPRRDAFVRLLATRTGWPPDRVETVLFGPPPTTDAALVAAVADLDQLVAAALTTQPSRPDPPADRPGGTP